MKNNNQPQESAPREPKKAYGSPLKQIRALCIDCAGGLKDVRYCSGTDCPLWYYRFGKSPKRVLREGGKDARILFDQEQVQKLAEEIFDLPAEKVN